MSDIEDTPASTSSTTATGNETLTIRNVGLGLGPAMRLVKFAKECKEKKLRSFSSYKTKKELKEVLRKYGIDSNKITKIPPFEPETVEIDDEDEELEQCITEIKRRMGIIGSTTGRNKAVRCEYISPILYASIYIAKRKELPVRSCRRRSAKTITQSIDVVNEELIAITEGKQSLGLVLPHVHIGKDLLLERRLSHSTYRENNERRCGTSPWCLKKL
ncbi:hypothetical protein C1646_757395 [Rhizophagus diaphanus]|nr:hypothetical protein C1646_757395 [Rhizophagus diaphanus] [Rhizophagus sp. MUCL 43196]